MTEQSVPTGIATFEVYQKIAGRIASKVPTLTLRLNGTFALNPAAYQLLNLAPRVQLLFNADTKQIGIIAATEETLNYFNVSRPGRERSGYISGRGFVQHYGITLTAPRRWLVHLTDDGILVTGPGPGALVSSNRKARS